MDENPYQSPKFESNEAAETEYALKSGRAVFPSMTLAYGFDQDDLWHWYRYYQKCSPAGRRQRTRTIVSSIVIYVGVAVLGCFALQNWEVAIAACAIALVLCFFTPLIYDQRVNEILKKQVSDPQLTGAFGPHQLVVSELGLREITPAAESLVRWEYITDVVRQADHVFVRLATGQAAVIPRASYSGPVPFDEIPRVIGEYRAKFAA